MTIISTLEIMLRADMARLQGDMDRARQTVDSAMGRISASVGNAMKMVAGFASALTVGAFVHFIKGGIDAADSLDELREKTGLLMKDVAGVRLIFQREGFGDQELTVSMSKLSKAIIAGGGGLGALKIATKETSGEFRSTQAVLYDVADRFAAMDNGAQKSALAMEIFGKSGVALIPMLNGGSEGMRDMAVMAQKLGLVISQETATAAGDFNDTLFLIGQGSQGVAQGIAAELLPTLNGLAGSFLTSMTSGDKLASTAAVLGAGLKILYTVGVGIVEVFSTVGKVIGAAAAQLVAYASFDFKAAAQIQIDATADIAAGWSGTATAISDAWTGAGADAVGAAAKVAKASKDLLADEASREAAAKKAAIDYAAAVKASTDFVDAMKVEAAQVGLSADQVKMMTAARAAAKAPTAALRLEIMAGALALDIATKAGAATVAVEKEVIESNKLAAAGLAAYIAMQKAYDEQVAKSIQSAVEEVEKNEALIKTFGLTKSAIERLELARLQDQLAQRSSTGLTLDEITALEKLIDAKQRNAAAVGSIEVLEKQKKVSDEAAAAQVSFWKSIDDTAHDTFVSIANGSKDTATRLKDTFKNVFFDWLYQMTIKKWIINIGTSSTGGVGDIATALGGGASAGGAGSSAIGLINAGKTIYEGFTTGFAGAGAALGGYVTTLGNLFGSSATSAFGAGMGLTSSQAASAAAAYNGAGMAGTGSALTAGSAAGAAAGIFAGAGVGYLGGNLISGQYGSKNTVAAGTAIGAAIGSIVPVVGTALGALIGGLLGGVANRLFGMGDKKVQSAMIDGSLTATGATGNNVSNWTQKGGWFRSDKKGVDSTALTSEQSTAFSTTYKAILDVSKVLGDTIGADTSALSARVQKLSIDLTGLATDADKLGAITKFFEGVADSIAVELVPNLTKFQKEGESLSVTMERIVTNYTGLDAMFAAVGTTFGAVGAGSIAAREGFIAVNGGLAALGTGLSYFQQSFLTEAQRLAPVQKQLADAFKAMGVAGVTTNAQFATYLLGIDKTTEAGATMFAQMLALAPAFNEITKATEAQAKVAAEAAAAQMAAQAEIAATLASTNKGYQDQIDKILAASEGSVAVRALEIKGLDASTIALYDRLAALNAATAAEKAAEDAKTATTKALLDGVAKAYSDAQAAVGAQKDVLNATYGLASNAVQAGIDRVTASVGKLQSLSDALHSTLDSMAVPGSEKSDRLAAQAQISAALAIAKAGGPLPDADAIKDALSTVSKDASGQFASYTDYMRDLYRTKNSVAGLSGLTDVQLSTEQLTLKTLEAQKSALDEAHKQDLAGLDATLAQYKVQTDILNGIYTSLMTLPQALAALGGAIGNATKDPGVSKDVVSTLYQGLLGRAPEAAGLSFWQTQFSNGASIDAIKAAIMGSSEYTKLHPFAVGTNYIPGDMPAMVHEGERIIPAADNRELMSRLQSPANNNSELVAETRALRATVEKLLAAADRSADSSEQGTGLLKRVIRNDKMYVEGAAA